MKQYIASKSRLEVSLGEHWELVSLQSNGSEIGAPSPEAFTMELLDTEGNALLLKSSEFQVQGNVFSGHSQMPSLKVELLVTSDGGFVHFRPRVTGIPQNWVLSWFDGPQVCYPRHKGIRLMQPLHDGVLLSEPLNEKAYHPIGFAKRGRPYGSFYPGRAQLQCMAFFDEEGNGAYFAAHDETCATKAVEYQAFPDYVRLSLQTFTGCNFGEDYIPDWDYVLCGFKGTWQDAAEIYRTWLEGTFIAKDEARLPEWIEQSPLVVIYPVRGHGKDTGEMEPNDYFPYSNALPYLRKIREQVQAPVMPLLMHWEGTAPWAPPYVWPPYGGEEMLFAFRDALHKEGNLLGVYCSGTAWTCSSSILKEYAPGCTPEQERMMLRGPKGELEASVCNGINSQRLGYDLCLAEEPARKIVMDELMKLADGGIDYAQFYDQNHGGCVHNCFARDHHHPPVPGSWQVKMQRNFMEEAIRGFQEHGRNMILGCESAAADAYSTYLPLNDARSSFMCFRGETIPLQQFVLHGKSTNFAGNQGGNIWSCDFSRSPYSLNRRLAYAFCAGDILSVILKGKGEAHWCWGCPWDFPSPNQEMFWELVKNMNQCRQKFPEYLLKGRMIKDIMPVSGEMLTEWTPEGNPRQYPAFYYSSWQAPDGGRMLFAVNYLDRNQRLMIGGEAHDTPACSVLSLRV